MVRGCMMDKWRSLIWRDPTRDENIMRISFEVSAIFLIVLSLSAAPAAVNGKEQRSLSDKKEALRIAVCLAQCQEKDAGSCREWFRKFKNGEFDVEDKERSGRPKVHEDAGLEALLEEDSCQTQEELALTLETNCREKCRSEKFKYEKNTSDDTGLADEKNEKGPANFNASLHCKDVDVLRIKHNPGIWVIEQISRDDNSTRENRDDENIRIQVIDRSTISSFTNLSAGSFYRYIARRVTSQDSISEPELSPWFQTLEEGHRSAEIKNIELTSQRLDDVNPSRVRADLTFVPASDRGCHYDVVSFIEDQGLTIGNLDSSQDFRVSLHDLNYATNVTVFVSARNIGNTESSQNVSLAFVTPSCIELYRNLTFCAPDEVTGLRISEIYKNESNYNIAVTWDEPPYFPDNYTLRIQSVDYFGDGEESSSVYTSVLPGNTTEAHLTIPAKFDDLDDRQRIISISAESAGGASLQSWMYFTFNGINESLSSQGVTAATTAKTDLPAVGLIAILSVALVAALLVVIVWIGRSRIKDPIGNNRGSDKPYKYCQSFNDVGKKSTNGSSTFYVMEKNLKLEFEKKDPLLGVMLDKFELRPAQLTIKQILGSGASGIVRLGSLRDSKKNSIDVAIKMLKDSPNTDDLKNFQQEISIMKSTGQHQNIVSIIGCCTIEVARPMLIVEYCSRGDLQTYLRTLWQEMVSLDLERRARTKISKQDKMFETIDNKVENITYWMEEERVAITNQLYGIQEEQNDYGENEEQLTVTELLSFARQVASGMEFLSSNRVIHRDLAARNVLLCADKTAKISDFGLSRDIYQENVYKKQGNSMLPLKWMAIEALTHQIYTTQSDVWSFGILLWEIVTLGCNPYPETPTNMILQVLKSGYRMEKPDNCGNELYNIMLSCWCSSPQRRPNFTQLKHQLDGLLRTASDNEYLNVYDLLRESTAITQRRQESMKLIEKNDYSNIYST